MDTWASNWKLDRKGAAAYKPSFRNDEVNAPNEAAAREAVKTKVADRFSPATYTERTHINIVSIRRIKAVT